MGIVLICLYAALILYTAGKAGRQSSAPAFFINNRASGELGVAFSILVSCIGASATIGMVGMAFTLGTPAFWWLGAGAVGLCVLSLFLAAKVRESGAFTMPQLVEQYLGKASRPLVSLIIVTAWLAILAAQFTALTAVLASMTALPPLICLGLGFGLVVTHTLGGQAAIMRTDKLQALVLALALALLLCWLGYRNPGWTGGVSLEAVNENFPPERLCYFFFVVGANYLVCPMLFGRFLSARDKRAARRGGLMAAGGIAGCALLIVCVGLACRGLIPADTPGDAVLTSALSEVLPPWMGFVVSLALVSAIVSSADSCLVTAATVLSFDLLRRPDTASCRACVIGLGLAGLCISFWGKGILGFLLMAYDLYACGVVPPVFVAMLLPKERRIDPRFACAAVAIGGTLGLAAAITGQDIYSYAGLAASGFIVLAGAGVAGMEYGQRPTA
jgi:Na+/proline symporter